MRPGDTDLLKSAGSFGMNALVSAALAACEDLLGDFTRGEPIVATGSMKPGKHTPETGQASHSLPFAGGAVDAATGEVRVRRMLGMFGIGRELDGGTARGQSVGGMIWGLSYAPIEDAAVDTRDGRFATTVDKLLPEPPAL